MRYSGNYNPAHSVTLFFLCMPFILHGSTHFMAPLSINKPTIIDGEFREHAINAPINIESGATLTIRNAVLTGITTETFTMKDDTSTLILQNTRVIMNNDIIWPSGRICIEGCSQISGPYCFHYISNSRCIINQFSTLIISDKCEFYYDPPSPLNIHLTLQSRSSILMLIDATLHSGQYGLALTKGTIVIVGECYAHIDNPNPRFGITLGSGQKYTDNIKFRFPVQSSRLNVDTPHMFIKKRSKNIDTYLLKKMAPLTPYAISLLGICALVSTYHKNTK